MEDKNLSNVQNIVSIIESLIVIATTVIGGILSDKKDNIVFLLIGIMLSELIVIVLMIKYIISRKEKDMIMFKKMIEQLHKDFIHKTRNHMHKLSIINSKVKTLNLNTEDGLEKYTDMFSEEYERLKDNLQPVVNCISDILSDYSKQNIATCIKIFNFDELHIHPLERHVTTFVRSRNTDNNRLSDEVDCIAVNSNTDFKRICKGKSMFASGDLKSLSDQELYKNDSDNWQTKYNSCMVVPIRYKPVHESNDKKTIVILGFLCIDSKCKNPRWEDKNCMEVQFLGMFADVIYMYLSSFVECFQR